MEKILEAFSFRDLQTFRNILAVLVQNKRTIKEALEYIHYKIAAVNVDIVFVGPTCPECAGNMRLYTVNTTPCNQIGGRWKSQWYCVSCGYSIFSKKSATKEAAKIKKRGI